LKGRFERNMFFEKEKGREKRMSVKEGRTDGRREGK
jgi:hypothetical protein